eukprot:scaffold542744_cov20-Prasinocladus_malaysianus.AAC.1
MFKAWRSLLQSQRQATIARAKHTQQQQQQQTGLCLFSGVIIVVILMINRRRNHMSSSDKLQQYSSTSILQINWYLWKSVTDAESVQAAQCLICGSLSVIFVSELYLLQEAGYHGTMLGLLRLTTMKN